VNLNDTPALIRDYERTRRLEEREQERQDRADLARAVDRRHEQEARMRDAQRLCLALFLAFALVVGYGFYEAVQGAHRYQRTLDDFRSSPQSEGRP
jgi:uncharacterized membrane protein YccC